MVIVFVDSGVRIRWRANVHAVHIHVNLVVVGCDAHHLAPRGVCATCISDNILDVCEDLRDLQSGGRLSIRTAFGRRR